MATRIQFSHLIHCHVDVFWRDFLDEELNRTLFLGDLGFAAYRLIERTERDGRVQRRVEIAPHLHVPAAVKNVIGERFSYVELGEFEGGEYRYQCLPPAGIQAGKASAGGVVRAEATLEGATMRHIELSCDIHIFGIGGMLENAMTKAGRENYEAHAKALNARLATRANTPA
jgi:hypothetical protein